MATEYINYTSLAHNSSERFLIFVQLAMLYKETGMLRKHNNLLYMATMLAQDLNPKVSNLLLMDILNSGLLREWPTLQAHITKLILNNGGHPQE